VALRLIKKNLITVYNLYLTSVLKFYEFIPLVFVLLYIYKWYKLLCSCVTKVNLPLPIRGRERDHFRCPKEGHRLPELVGVAVGSGPGRKGPSRRCRRLRTPGPSNWAPSGTCPGCKEGKGDSVKKSIFRITS